MSQTGDTLISKDLIVHAAVHSAFMARAFAAAFAIQTGRFSCPLCPDGLVTWVIGGNARTTGKCSTSRCLTWKE